MPWDATRLRVAAVRAGRDARRVDARRRRPGRVDRPARVVARRHPPPRSATGAAGGTSTACVDGPRLEPLAPMEAEFADPAWIFDRSSYGFLADGGDRGRRPGRRSRPPLPHRAGPSASARSRSPFTELEGAARRAGTAIVALAGAPGRPGDRRPVRPVDPGAGRRPAPGEHGRARSGDRSRAPSRSTFPTTGGRTAHALYYPPTNPDFVGPDGRAAAAHRPDPRRPDVERLDRARPRPSSC